jgi:hypothetical protein
MDTLRPWLRPQIGLGMVFFVLAFGTDKVAFFLLGVVLLGAGLQASATFREKVPSLTSQASEQESDAVIFDMRL